MRYFTVTEEELEAARPGLVLIEQLMEDNDDFKPFIYGITTKETVLLSANEALAYYAEEGETAPSTDEVALAIPFSSKAIYYLTGSGLSLSRTDFAYRAGRDDVRSHWLSDKKVQVNIHDFTAMALSDDEIWLDDFLKEHGVRSGAATKDIVVPRDNVQATRPKGPSHAASKKARLEFRNISHGIDSFLK